MKQNKLSKEEIKKLALSVIGFIALLYVYFSFFLGPLNRSRASMIAVPLTEPRSTGTELEREIGP